MRLTAACVLSWLVLAATALAQLRSTASLVVQTGDGGWYAATEDEAVYPNPKSIVRRYLADFRTVVWERRVTGDYPRELRATPDGGVALLGVALGAKGFLRTWDREGNARFSLVVGLPSASASSLPEAHFALDPGGNFLLVSGSAEYERVRQPFNNSFRVSGGSLDVRRISALGDPLFQAKLPIPTSSLAGVEFDGTDSVFVAGGTESDDLPLSAGAIQTQRLGGICSRGISFPISLPCTSGWIARLDAKSLEIKALTYLGGHVENALTALAVDRDGYPVVAGSTGRRWEGVENAYPRTPGAVEPSATRVFEPVATLSRLSPNLDALVDSAWIEGAATTAASALAIDSQNRILLGGYTATRPDVANLAGWSRACGPRSSQTSWGFLMRLPERIESIGRVFQFEHFPSGRIAIDNDDNAVFDNRIQSLDSRVACLVNAADFTFTSVAAPGLLISVYGGPFSEDEPVTVDGLIATVLSRSSSAMSFVVPRLLGARRSAELTIGSEPVRTLRVLSAKPTWKAAVTPDGQLTESGNYLIEARRSDGEANSRTNPFRPNEEVRAYATGIDLTKSLHIFVDYPKVVDLLFTAEYVPGTAEGIVEFRFTNPYPTLTPGGLTLLRIENDGIETPNNPGFIWNPLL
ncbi:MAG: hypothetical protein ACKV22_12025 [Bryobacteraceae bacterium]